MLCIEPSLKADIRMGRISLSTLKRKAIACTWPSNAEPLGSFEAWRPQLPVVQWSAVR